MLFNMSDEEWDAIMHVHLRGHFLLSRNASAYWRLEGQGDRRPGRRERGQHRLEAFLSGPPGQANYGAARPASPR